MPIHFSCANCSKSYRVDDTLAGRKATCKACGRPMQVPMEERATKAVAVEAGPMIDWDAIAAASSQPVAAVPMARVKKKTMRQFGSSSDSINPYRVARLIFGIAFVAASIGLAIGVWKISSMARTPDTLIHRRIAQGLYLSLCVIFGTFGFNFIRKKTTHVEMTTPFLHSISRPMRVLYAVSCVAFLMVLLMGELIHKDVAALILVVLGGGTVARGIGKLMEEKKREEKNPSLFALDRLIVGLLPLFLAAPYWIWKMNKVMNEP